MRVSRRLLAASCLLMLALAATTASADASPSSPVVGHVYVNDNTAGANTVAGLARHADGTLTALPGSPFAAGGAGTGARASTMRGATVLDQKRSVRSLPRQSNVTASGAVKV